MLEVAKLLMTCLPNKTEVLNLSAFNTITKLNESKTLAKHASVNVNLMEENVIQINGGITINVNVSVKRHVWNPATCSCENGKYLASIMDDLATACDEVIESYNKDAKTNPTIFNEKKATCKM